MESLNKSNVQSIKDTIFCSKLKVLIVVSFMGLALFTSCGEDDIADALGFDCGTDWTDFTSSHLSDFTNAGIAYEANPTTENCNAYKNAGNRYVDALENLEECYPGAYEGDWDEYINDVRAEINNLCD
ncbi:hypothetical protein BN863_32630 [Formosa agariphila KMM 3901]|uniref:Uncharacterized protein n=1 Tax=Formosa agariphila (strain DSM 15362 / KCTC 12365 / LMG 23005 / KMM 3901 / M-2Alg 35-1) TaxID=1347342 RepID=T2KQG6_FORAG|nr:hypothetical protein [Formosa agariphila]CDF80975.1 hypothetical protein BN863_32630 [Formosa agariphila KMM 3901]